MRKRHALHQAVNVNCCDEAHLTEITLTLAVLALSEVPATLLATQDFAGPSDFEPLGDAFSGLASSNFLSHKRGGKWQTSPSRQGIF